MFRNFVFTLNNYTLDDINNIESWTDISYLIFGRERGALGTEHLQGYIEFKSPIRVTTLKNRNNRIHWEARKGTQNQAIEYCKKEGDFTEHGEPKQQGARTDLDRFRTASLEEGMRYVSSYGNYQQIKTAEIFLTYNEEPRDWKPEVTWIWGPSGVGKSKRTRELLNNPYTKSDGTKWWPGYDGHEDVILDDFRDSWWGITEMLSLLDRYEKRIEYKGGYRQFKAKRIIITSCKPPELCYQGTGESITQLLRRIDSVTDVTEVAGG